MATLNQPLTSDWVDISTAQSLTNGLYNLYCAGGQAELADVASTATAVPAGLFGRRMVDGHSVAYKQVTGTSLWVKGVGVGTLVIDDA